MALTRGLEPLESCLQKRVDEGAMGSGPLVVEVEEEGDHQPKVIVMAAIPTAQKAKQMATNDTSAGSSPHAFKRRSALIMLLAFRDGEPDQRRFVRRL